MGVGIVLAMMVVVGVVVIYTEGLIDSTRLERERVYMCVRASIFGVSLQSLESGHAAAPSCRDLIEGIDLLITAHYLFHQIIMVNR